MRNRIKWIGIIFVVLCVLSSGCVDNSTNSTQQKVEQSVDYKIVVCPNPNCALHDPNTKNSLGERNIDMEYAGSSGTKKYLCQSCGAEWSG